MKNSILQMVRQVNPINPIEYVHDIVRDYAREKLDNYIAVCSDCDICDKTKSLTKGSTRASIMIITEAVSLVQISGNKDFVYPLEKTKGFVLLDKVLQHYKVNSDELFYMNVVNCLPYKKINDEILSRTPSKKEVDNCKVFLEYAIDIVKPSLILLLGSVALNVFHQEAISKARGNWLTVKGIPAMPTYHPEFFIQIEDKKHPDIVEEHKLDFCNDILKALLYFQSCFPDNNVLLETLKND